MKRHPRAHAFELGVCENPTCGPHIIAKDHNDEPICEVIMSRKQGLEFIKALQALLYVKAVERD